MWRAANLLIGRNGADAELEATRSQDLMLDRSDNKRIRFAEKREFPQHPPLV
jgi:hypothetical protein